MGRCDHSIIRRGCVEQLLSVMLIIDPVSILKEIHLHHYTGITTEP